MGLFTVSAFLFHSKPPSLLCACLSPPCLTSSSEPACLLCGVPIRSIACFVIVLFLWLIHSISLDNLNTGLPCLYYFNFENITFVQGVVWMGIMHLTHTARKWRSEGSFQEPLLSFHHIGPRVQSQVPRLGGKWLYLLRHFTEPSLLNILCHTLILQLQIRQSFFLWLTMPWRFLSHSEVKKCYFLNFPLNIWAFLLFSAKPLIPWNQSLGMVSSWLGKLFQLSWELWYLLTA